jgi:hypothetical protein
MRHQIVTLSRNPQRGQPDDFLAIDDPAPFKIER